jgi:hypothetical protein
MIKDALLLGLRPLLMTSQLSRRHRATAPSLRGW